MSLKAFFIDEEIESFLEEQLKKNDSEVFSSEYKGKKIWIKRARETKSSFLHSFFYKLFPFEVLHPVKEKNKEEAVSFESSKLIHFKKLGIPTPEVLATSSKYLVLEDCGKMVNSYIRKRDIEYPQMKFYLDNMILLLSKIHNNNEYHGGAQARNFTFFKDTFYVIDFEDSFEDNIDLKLLQFRDLLLLLLSLTKTRASFEVDYKLVINEYISQTGNNDFIIRFKLLANKISFLISLSENKFINNLLGRDGKGFFKLFKVLKEL